MRTADAGLLGEHYAEHRGRPHFEPLVEFMGSRPLVAAVVEGTRVLEGFRSLAGSTEPTTAAPGTIRGDLARAWDTPVIQHLVRGPAAPESAARTSALWFPSL